MRRASCGQVGDVDDRSDAVDPIAQDAFDPGLQRLVRRRTPDARTDELDRHEARGLVDVAQHDVATVGLEGGADDLDGGFDLVTHVTTIQSAEPVRFAGVMAVSAASPVLLARQGGWDEILLISGPIVVIMGLLWVAKRRVDRAASLHGPGGNGGPRPGPSDTD